MEMKITWKNIFFASLCVPLTLALCVCLTYLGLEIWKICGEGPHEHIPEEEFFFVVFVVMMICSLFAGKSLLNILIKVRWKHTNKLPERSEGTWNVAFITKERCLLNGLYDFKEKVFVSYAGLVYRKNEVVSWCIDYDMKYLVKYFEYPEQIPL